DLADGQQVICDWYNIPDQQTQRATIRVTKFTCDAGYDAGKAAYGDFLNDCPNTTKGVTFQLTGKGETEPRTDVTNGSGVASFSPLSANPYQLSEDVPGEASTPYAFCTTDGGDPIQADLSDGHAYLEIDSSTKQVDCDWFNVPEDLAANASVTITKYQCP